MRQGFRDLFSSVAPKTPPASDPSLSRLYYCGDTKGEPLMKDLYMDFCQFRREQAVARMNEFDRLEANMKMLEMKIDSTEMEEKRKTGSHRVDFATNLWSHVPHLPHSRSKAQQPTVNCEFCGNQTKQPKECCLCSGICCNNCGNSKIPIQTKSGEQNFPVCNSCEKLFLKHKHENNWKKQIEQAEKHPLVISRDVLNEIEECIKRVLPKYENVVNEIKSQTFPASMEAMPAVFQNALKYENILSQFYDNYQLGIEKAKKYNPNGSGEKRLQTRFIQGKMLVYQQYYPPFRVLKAELKQKIPKLVKKKELNAVKVETPKKPERVIKPPIIASIEPAVITTDGGDVVVRGSFFHPAAKVFVNGLEVSTVQINSDTLYAEAPGYPISANVPLFVRNPDADSENISLIYDDQEDGETLNTSIEGNALQDINQESSLVAGFSGWGHDPYESPHTPTIAPHHPARVWGSETEPIVFEETKKKSQGPKPIRLKRDMYLKSNPSVSTITPILSPPGGIEVTITGYQFAMTVEVSIGPITLDEETTYALLEDEKIECTIKCHTPALPEGMYSVKVKNPKGGKACMENVLVYIPHHKWLSLTREQPTQQLPIQEEFELPEIFAKSPPRRVWG